MSRAHTVPLYQALPAPCVQRGALKLALIILAAATASSPGLEREYRQRACSRRYIPHKAAVKISLTVLVAATP